MPCRIDIHYRPTEAAKIVFDYEIHHAQTNQLLATGHSVQVFMDKEYRLVWIHPGVLCKMERTLEHELIVKEGDNLLTPLGMTSAESYRAVKAGQSALRRYEGLWGVPEPFVALPARPQSHRSSLGRPLLHPSPGDLLLF